MNKRIYIDCYFRVAAVKDGANETLYANYSVCVDNIFGEPEYHEALKQVEAHFLTEGYLNISVSSCSQEEFEDHEIKEEERPIGYFKIYQKAHLFEKEEEKMAYTQIKADFNLFIDDTFWDLVAKYVKTVYESSGCTVINVFSATEEEYQLNVSPDTDVLYEKEWNDHE